MKIEARKLNNMYTPVTSIPWRVSLANIIMPLACLVNPFLLLTLFSHCLRYGINSPVSHYAKTSEIKSKLTHLPMRYYTKLETNLQMHSATTIDLPADENHC